MTMCMDRKSRDRAPIDIIVTTVLRSDKAPISTVVDVTMTVIFTLKIFDNLFAHLNSQLVGEVQHIMSWLALTPFVPAMGFEYLPAAIYHLLGGPGPKVMEPGSIQPAVLPIKGDDPLIHLSEIVLPINMAWRRGAI